MSLSWLLQHDDSQGGSLLTGPGFRSPSHCPFTFWKVYLKGAKVAHITMKMPAVACLSITKCLVAVMPTDTEGRCVNAFFVLFFMLLLSLLSYWNKFVSYLLSPWKVKIWVRPKVYIVQYPSTDSDQYVPVSLGRVREESFVMKCIVICP